MIVTTTNAPGLGSKVRVCITDDDMEGIVVGYGQMFNGLNEPEGKVLVRLSEPHWLGETGVTTDVIVCDPSALYRLAECQEPTCLKYPDACPH